MTLTPEMEVAAKYGSHMPSLLACIAITSGPVLELGVGHFSTPHLHALCGATNRKLVSVESNEEWRNEFVRKYGSTPDHSFFSGLTDIEGERWSVSLIDHSPGGANRADAFRALIGACGYVVVHDAQKDAENFEHIAPMLGGLYWHLCLGYFPHTLVASRTLAVPQVLLRM